MSSSMDKNQGNTTNLSRENAPATRSERDFVGVQLMTARDVARELRISLRQVWRLKAAGKLPKAVRIGNSVRWDRTDLEQWLRELKGEKHVA